MTGPNIDCAQVLDMICAVGIMTGPMYYGPVIIRNDFLEFFKEVPLKKDFKKINLFCLESKKMLYLKEQTLKREQVY
jgi:hypothetical protein